MGRHHNSEKLAEYPDPAPSPAANRDLTKALIDKLANTLEKVDGC